MGKGPATRGSQPQQSSTSSSRELRHGVNDVPRSRDGDLLASAASALRRLHFKSIGGGGRGAVPKLIVRGTSTTSETTINTSTDSANTLMTIVTTTDSEQQNDSLDLIDMCGELSPPPDDATAATRSGSNGCATTAVTTHIGSNSSSSSSNSSKRSSSSSSSTSSGPSSNSPLSSSSSASAPPPANASGHNVTVPVSVVVTSTSPQQQQQQQQQQQTKPIENGLPAKQMNGELSTTTSPTALQNGPSTRSSLTMGPSGTNSPGPPPPTPMVGSHQESRFTFPPADQRIRPALPDLRDADFFSQAVRGSVDAGQPDQLHISSMLALAAAKDKLKNSSNSTAMTPLTTASSTSTLKSHSQQQSPMNDMNGNVGDRSPSQEKSPRGSVTPTSGKLNINVTTNPLDITLCAGQTQNGARARSRPAAGAGGTGVTERTAQATIVVQQPSLSLDTPPATLLLRPSDARRREENMRQLLDVTNTFTLQEIHDFEMKYGSPHHSRSQSVKTPGSRSGGRPNYLCLPQQRSRVASMPNTGTEEEYYRLRHFSITTKGVVNRGDSLKSRRSRSNNSVASSNSSTEHLTASYPGSARNSAAGSLASSRESSASQGPAPFRVLMLGSSAVGKSSLVSQFMTSEYLHAYDTSIDDESGEQTVSVLLAGEESELTFIDHPCSEMAPENCIASYEPHGYCVVYSITDRSSVRTAEEVLQSLWRSDHIPARAVILVANKVDLARSRLVSTEEGKSMAISYDCKFIETSMAINHNVDELLVGLLTQIRLKLENPERNRDLFRRRSRRARSRSPLGSCSENNSPKKYRNSRTSASLKVRSLLGKVWARDSKSKSCENLHVL